MEHHRNPSPPDTSPTASHDTSSGNNQLLCNEPDPQMQESASSLVDYDDCIGDTVFSKAWVLSILVKAIDAVKEQESKIENLTKASDDVDKDLSDSLQNRIIQSHGDESDRTDTQMIGMKSSECIHLDRESDQEPSDTDTTLCTISAEHRNVYKADRDAVPIQEQKDNHNSSSNMIGKETTSYESGADRERQGKDERKEEEREDGEAMHMIDHEDSFGDSVSLRLEEISESLENDLCRLWDASMNMDVAQFIHEQQGVELLLGVATRSTAPRLTEICIGLLGNMACSKCVCMEGLSNSRNTIQMLLQFLGNSDTRILYETTRLIVTCLSHEKARSSWLQEIHQSDIVYPALLFILQGSTNAELLQSSASLLDRLLDCSTQLLKEWATSELVMAICEAAEQVRMSCADATCSLFMSLQLLSTQEDGVAAIVECEEKVLGLLSSFLCDLDHLEGFCSPVMATFSLFIALRENSTSDLVSCKLADTDFVGVVQKISHQADELSRCGSDSQSTHYSELHKLTLQLLK